MRCGVGPQIDLVMLAGSLVSPSGDEAVQSLNGGSLRTVGTQVEDLGGKSFFAALETHPADGVQRLPFARDDARLPFPQWSGPGQRGRTTSR